MFEGPNRKYNIDKINDSTRIQKKVFVWKNGRPGKLENYQKWYSLIHLSWSIQRKYDTPQSTYNPVVIILLFKSNVLIYHKLI